MPAPTASRHVTQCGIGRQRSALPRPILALLLLTDDGRLQASISEPASRLRKHYWVQVEGSATDEHLRALRQGVLLKDGPATALEADLVAEPARLWPRTPPIRSRKRIPTSWLDVVIDEGRNRQLRRMTAAAGLPALRLIRHRIGPWNIGDLRPGEQRTIQTASARKQLVAERQAPLA